jgi:hypothetical protein
MASVVEFQTEVAQVPAEINNKMKVNRGGSLSYMLVNVK